MSKKSRYQSIINKQSDEEYSEDHWLKQFESTLQKTSVRPKGQNLHDQIISIMNVKSRYSSVQDAVDDMMKRSGLTDYLQNIKTSENEIPSFNKKIAQQESSSAKKEYKLPRIMEENPNVKRTLENIIKETKGNIPVPAIIARLRSLHASDISDDSMWEDEKLVRLVSQYNLKAKTDNPTTHEYHDLGKGDHSTADRDLDPSNTDAFNALMPAKI